MEKLLKLLILMAAVTEFILGPLFIFGAPFLQDLPGAREVVGTVPVIPQILGLFLLGFGYLLLLSLKDIERFVPFLLVDAVVHLGIGLVDAYCLLVFQFDSVLVSLGLWVSLVVDTGWGVLVLYGLYSLGYVGNREQTPATAG